MNDLERRRIGTYIDLVFALQKTRTENEGISLSRVASAIRGVFDKAELKVIKKEL